MPTATTTAPAGVDSQLEVVERKVPLELERVDYTVHNPAALTARLADPLQYAQRVEIIVTGLGIEHLLPRHDERIARFLDDLDRGRDDPRRRARHPARPARARDLRADRRPAADPQPARQAPRAALAAGPRGRRARSGRASGAMNEHLAMSAYREMGVVVDELGERSLYETLFKRLRTHEAAHKGFYAAYAREVAQGMHRWQRRLARAIIVHTYAPVGAGAKVDKPALGRTVRALDPDGGWEEKVADPVQRIAEKLLADGEPLPRFVRDAMAECVESVRVASSWAPARAAQAGAGSASTGESRSGAAGRPASVRAPELDLGDRERRPGWGDAVDEAAGGRPAALGEHPGQAGVGGGVGVERLVRQVVDAAPVDLDR